MEVRSLHMMMPVERRGVGDRITCSRGWWSASVARRAARRCVLGLGDREAPTACNVFVLFRLGAVNTVRTADSQEAILRGSEALTTHRAASGVSESGTGTSGWPAH